MNMILCGEDCRHQKDGYCMLEDLTHARSEAKGSKCVYYER